MNTHRHTLPHAEQLDALAAALPQAMCTDRRDLSRRLEALRRRMRAGKPIDRGLAQLAPEVEASVARHRLRQERRPRPRYPEELPVSARRADIAQAIAAHQVVVVAGETGSGKTTQLPKICLEGGRGAAGLIGHTQPRRIAARSVAARIAAELDTEVGAAVGYKVRFSDRVSPRTYVKLMTDGILLAETQADKWLDRYDTLIIDEAHERSLNIDFLLGYLKQLLPQRPDLKLIITSATIDTERFAQHFDAPIIEVSGRTYPVEIRYRPIVADDEDARDRDLQQAIAEAVEEAGALDPLGDILIFLPGEREIRETAEALHRQPHRHTEILPLYARLSAAEQNRVFQPHSGRRIVLATNVAETSLTVPGIRYVIDTGLARISRYSHRTKVQRLPVEAVAQASANQRAGRCGRTGPGICFRLYSEADFLGRPAFTEPEIQRTNLASVILQMKALGLGDVERFPFVDPPDKRFVNDGYRLLHEVGAVDERRELTALGRQLVRFPLDPRIARMVIAAGREGCLEEILIVAAALGVQDPRERPLDAQQKADEAHRRFRDEDSDFVGFLNLWREYHEQARHLSRNKLRQWCRDHYLSFVRMREWHDTHSQLAMLAHEMGLRPNQAPADYVPTHRALLTGLLSQVALRTEEAEPSGRKKGRQETPYTGARNIKLAIFPGSALQKAKPKWIMAAEWVETSRMFARGVARIDARWLEELGAHLVKRSYSEPHWEKRAAQVGAFEQVTLFGLIIVARRRIHFGPVDPKTARALFIRHALVEGDYRTSGAFMTHNRALLGEIEALEAKARRRDVLVDEQALFDFYDHLLPDDVYSGARFEQWRKHAERDDPRLLFLSREQLMRHEAETVTGTRFPESMVVGGLTLPLAYRFEPGHAADGVTACVPLAILNQLPPEPFEWLVPGLIEEKLAALLRALPKSIRRNFVPVPDFAAACAATLSEPRSGLLAAFADALRRMTGVSVEQAAWQPQALPDHLRMNFRVLDGEGAVIGEGRDLAALQRRFGAQAQQSLREAPGGAFERTGLREWRFGDLPEQVAIQQGALRLPAYPAVVDEGQSVGVRLFDTLENAESAMREGLGRLFALSNAQSLRYLRKNLPQRDAVCLLYAPLGRCEALLDDIVAAVVDQALFGDDASVPRTADAFVVRAEGATRRLVTLGNQLAQTLHAALREQQAVSGLLREVIAQAPEAVEDIRDQLDRLIFPGFVAATPYAWLLHYPRYLEAIRLRLNKLREAPERDRRLRVEMATLWRDYWVHAKAAEGLRSQREPFRWSLEELRVSLFAQQLRTLYPVSVSRLQKQWRQRSSEIGPA